MLKLLQDKKAIALTVIGLIIGGTGLWLTHGQNLLSPRPESSGISINGDSSTVYGSDEVSSGPYTDANFTGHRTSDFAGGISINGDTSTVYGSDEVSSGPYTDANFTGHRTADFAGGVYEGYWVDGTPNGKGRVDWANGNWYEGDWVDGQRTGQGTLTQFNDIGVAFTHVGAFVNGIPHGKGRVYIGGVLWDEGVWVDGWNTGMPQ